MNNAGNDAGFRHFLERYKDTFPYNDVRVTRNGIHSKWLLLERNAPLGIRFYTGSLFAVLAQTIDAEIVKQLIISRRALPMPDDFSLLLDRMYFWGRSVSFHWY